jgi:hypothetical protein
MGCGAVYVMSLGPTTYVLIYISQPRLWVGVSNLTVTYMHYTSFLIIITRANATILERGRGGVDSGDGARGVADGGTSEGRGCWGHRGGPMMRGGIDDVIVSEGADEGDCQVEGEVGSGGIAWEG